MMEEQWLVYLRENVPDLYDKAVESRSHDALCRDERIEKLEAELTESQFNCDKVTLATMGVEKDMSILIGENAMLREACRAVVKAWDKEIDSSLMEEHIRRLAALVEV